MKSCYCNSKKDYLTCCAPYLTGEKPAPNPEALMRSRYAAFVQANMDYIVATMKGKAAKDFDPVSTKVWAETSEWLGLEIIKSTPLSNEKTQGFVEFIARYKLQGKEQAIHELSEFNFEEGRWYYVDGRFLETPTQLQKKIKIGRNDPCSCGSGIKLKKCCGKETR